MRKSMQMQNDLAAELGTAVFDVTLDAEDGAPLGNEREHAQMIAELASSSLNQHGRVGARVHPVQHDAFSQDLEIMLGSAGDKLAYIMVPKPESLVDVASACDAIDKTSRALGLQRQIPVHALIETHGALRDVFAICAHPRIESVSFGLMDFVSEHRGAVPSQAMGVQGQFAHPLVMRAKLEIAAAAHASGKTPSHCVVTEFKDRLALSEAARKACQELGYTRMWSIHPDQIRTIVDAFAPHADEIQIAGEILLAAQAANWAPVRHKTRGHETLHDRASYRYFWQILERAHQTGRLQDVTVHTEFFA